MDIDATLMRLQKAASAHDSLIEDMSGEIDRLKARISELEGAGKDAVDELEGVEPVAEAAPGAQVEEPTGADAPAADPEADVAQGAEAPTGEEPTAAEQTEPAAQVEEPAAEETPAAPSGKSKSAN